jgi:hypothetical protein
LVQAGINAGVKLATLILGIVIATYFVAYSMPGALNVLATTVFSSTVVGPIFNTLLELVIGFVVILAFVRLLGEA